MSQWIADNVLLVIGFLCWDNRFMSFLGVGDEEDRATWTMIVFFSTRMATTTLLMLK